MHAAVRRPEIHALVKLLRNLHSALGMKAEALGRGLLQRRGLKRRLRALGFFRFFDAAYPKFPRAAGIDNFLRRISGRKLDFPVCVPEKLRLSLLVSAKGKNRFNRPKFLRNEFFDFRFAFHDNPCGDGLHTSRRKTAFYGFPKVRAELIAHNPVKHAARLLGIDEIHIDCARMLDLRLDGVLGNFIERHAVRLLRRDAEDRSQMP